MRKIAAGPWFTRRQAVSALAGAAGALLAGRKASASAVLTEDGLYRQSWFLDSLLELADDLDAAAEKGKRFAVIWELRGCPYCKKTHLVNFAVPQIEDYIRERFDILQLNIIGAREVVDFDGERLSEKKLAQKYGIRFTPTFQFFAESSAGLRGKKPQDREVTRSQGYLEPKPFLAMFRFIAERGYERSNLRDFLKGSS
jgi:thioredoxin-related protein